MCLYHIIHINVIYILNVLIFARSVLPETPYLLEWIFLVMLLFLLSHTTWDWLPQPILKVVLGVSTLPFKHKKPFEYCLHGEI